MTRYHFILVSTTTKTTATTTVATTTTTTISTTTTSMTTRTTIYSGPVSWLFTNCGKSKNIGPSQADCHKSYEEQRVEIIKNGYQEWKIPRRGEYRIEAYGAQGGSVTRYSNVPDKHQKGGKGAKITGEYIMEKDQGLFS